MEDRDTWRQMRKHLSNMAQTIDSAVRKVSPFGGAGPRRPLVDVCEGEDEIIVYAEVAGVPGDALSVTLKQGVLTIAGREDRTACEGCTYVVNERGPAEFSRDLALPPGADPEAEPVASLSDGLLTVRIPRRPPAEGRTIHVDVA